jgi:FkbM family methyltransferase
VYAFGFEPDSGARQKLQQNTDFLGGGNIDFPYALSDKKEQLEINILKKPSHSSALDVNFNLLNRFPHRNLKGFELDYKVTVDAYDLDSLEFEAKDFMKIDVQGYELKVLKGAESSLKELLGLEVEIEFFEMYRNQCSFGEIKDYLLKHDFEFLDFTSLTRYERDSGKNHLGLCIGGDALFLKTPEFIFDKYKDDRQKLGAYLSICLIYKRYDLINLTLKLFSLEDSKDYLVFTKACKVLRKRLNFADRVSRISTRIIGYSVSTVNNSTMFY